MAKVIMESWREGLQKVTLAKLQNEKLGLSLSESKRNVDMLLDDQTIILEIENENVARGFLEEANRFGVNCKMIYNKWMDLIEFKVENKNDYYNLASEYFNNINSEEYENIKFENILPQSISLLMDHEFILTPCIKVKMSLFQDQKEIGAYYLYVTKDKEFVDEFLIIK